MALLQTSKCTSWKPAFATRTHVNVRHIRERPVIPASKGQLYNSGEEWAYSQPVLPDVGGLGGSFLDRASRKGSLLETNNTASTASLAWVELMHWILFFTAIWVSYRMFTHFTALGTAMSFYTFMLCSFGLVQASVVESTAQATSKARWTSLFILHTHHCFSGCLTDSASNTELVQCQSAMMLLLATMPACKTQSQQYSRLHDSCMLQLLLSHMSLRVVSRICPQRQHIYAYNADNSSKLLMAGRSRAVTAGNPVGCRCPASVPL